MFFEIYGLMGLVQIMSMRLIYIFFKMNNQTNCHVASEILKKMWICLVFIRLYLAYYKLHPFFIGPPCTISDLKLRITIGNS